MTKKIGDKKLGGVKQTPRTVEVETTSAISGVAPVRPAAGIGGVKAPGAIGKRRPTRIMTAEEREQLLQMVNEETEKIFKSGLLPPQKKDVVTKAVKMAIDASILSEKEEDIEDGGKDAESKGK